MVSRLFQAGKLLCDIVKDAKGTLPKTGMEFGILAKGLVEDKS